VTVQSNKTIGAVGASLTLTGIVSTAISIYQQISGVSANLIVVGVTAVVGVLAFVGLILFLVAMYGFSKDYAENRIFNYLIYAILVGVVSVVILGIAWFGFAMISVLSQVSSAVPPSSSTQIQALITPYLAALLPVAGLIMFAPLFFIYRAYNTLSLKSGVSLFRGAAKIFMLSAVLNVLLGVAFAIFAFTGGLHYPALLLAFTPGAVVQYIAWAFTAKGFFDIQPPAIPTMQTQPYAAGQNRYCLNCGTQVQTGDAYCVRCGKKL
jgi:uncharacterized membrane protein